MSKGDVRSGEANATNALEWSDASPHQLGFAQGDDVRLNFLDWGGDGAPLVLIHGIANSPHIFDDLAPLLRDRFRVLAYARRGHGQSAAPSGRYDSEALVGDFRCLLDDLGIARANLLGWSMGGNEITEFAGRYPERVDKLVYLDGGYDWSDPAFFKPFTEMLVTNSPRPQTLRSFDNLRSWYHAAWVGRAVHWTPALEAFLRDAVRIAPNGRVDPIPSIEVLTALMTTLGEWRRDYTKVRAPALAIYAASFFPVDRTDAELVRKLRDFEDRVVAPFRQASVARIRRELPSVQVIELDGRSHMSIGVIEPETVAAAIKRFLLSTSDDAA